MLARPNARPSLVHASPRDTDDHAAAPGALMPLLLTVAQAAELLSVSRTTLYELLAGGSIESIHIGRSRRVPIDALRDFVESQRQDTALRYR